ncbi:MAG: hypothetical protein D6706_21710 [Chloroflexi bacterium]|nr:MAG: hypothetical protein D6706_21710 [Chloroflexota bacterium]
MSVEAAEPIFERVWPWLRVHYEEWADLIRPFWLRTKAGGQPVTQDPFRLLLSLQHPQAIKGNWQAMQHLPAAREALNQFILSRARQE